MSEEEGDPPPEKTPKEGGDVVPFPHARSRPTGGKGNYRDLGLTPAAKEYGTVQPNVKGHWCSRCKGIWWGFVGECECPVCGNRNG